MTEQDERYRVLSLAEPRARSDAADVPATATDARPSGRPARTALPGGGTRDPRSYGGRRS
ncbi:hypothetical protein [Kitasatospora purpeofusca]|uniref:hypothetical protein n=1 Tax=Kitasatospora purpeofusca TaxID=67352 RepID=UPI0038204B98